MAQPKTIYTCQQCGFSSPRWLGRCPECSEWNSFVESLPSSNKSKDKQLFVTSKKPLTLEQITTPAVQRWRTTYSEFNRVTGGGIVPGSVILVGGEPGIGKSTLLLQIAATLPQKTIYVSAEESLEQLKLRAERLGIKSQNMAFVSATCLEEILTIVESTKPDLLIVDSIQTIYSENLAGTPGSVGQVRECAQLLTTFAKTNSIPVFLVGHITKEGTIAGPKTLEHLVDVVLYFEGEQHNQFRIIRSVKNRFGAVDEVGIFTMQDTGLVEVTNASEIFISTSATKAPGSVIVATIEGTRPVLVEIQALTSKTAFGYPRRTTSGIDLNRLYLLTAVLNKHAGLALDVQDIYLNVTGGLAIHEPAADLGIVLALYSSYKNRILPEKLVVFGEIGLSGELRPVSTTLQRLSEIERLGFKQVIIPKTDLKNTATKLIVHQIQTLQEVWKIVG